MDLIKLLKVTPSYLSTFLINIYLVYRRVRKCCLLEITHIREHSNNPYIDMLVMTDIANHFGLKAYEESKNMFRCLIGYPEVITEFQKAISDVKDDNEYHEILGVYLGFRSVGHQWSNWRKKRVHFHINVDFEGTSHEVVVFMCEFAKTDITSLLQYMVKMTESFKQVLPRSFKVSFYYEIDEGLESRIDALIRKDLVYIRNYYNEYYNDLNNQWKVPSNLLAIFERALDSQEALNAYAEILIKHWRLFEKDILNLKKINKLDALLH